MEKDERTEKIVKVTLLGSCANLLLLVFKFLAGIWGQSSALVADAVHSLSDFVTDVVVLLFVKISSKPQDEGHDYGHGKYETFATLIIGVVLLMVGFGLLWGGVDKIVGYYLRGEELERPEWVAWIAAVVSILVKELLYQITCRVGMKMNSQAVVANAWHHRSDALSSVGTALGVGGAIMLGSQWRVLDAFAATVVSLFIIKVSLQLALPAVNDLLEQSLPKSVEDRIVALILETPEVKSPHNLRTRRIGNRIAIEVHVRVDGEMTVCRAHELTRIVECKLRKEFGETTHVVLHVEPVK